MGCETTVAGIRRKDTAASRRIETQIPEHSCRRGVRGARSGFEEQLELEFVVDPHSGGVTYRDRRLELPRYMNGMPVQRAQIHAQALVEADGGKVVVRGDEPDPPAPLCSRLSAPSAPAQCHAAAWWC